MRDFFKIIILGIVLAVAPQVYAEGYNVLIMPDNIVTENAALDSYIYDASAEFFADKIVTILNGTDYIKSTPVSQTRNAVKKDARAVIAAKNLTDRFRTSYIVDYSLLKKAVAPTGARYVLLLTSAIDAQNYIMRRTVWDFLNIPGATVVDPAYKISTYAVLVDTNNNKELWSDTYYKTISSCENRIITRGPSPQTVQLEKIKDYSEYLCPQIAQKIQQNVLPPSVYARESKQIEYDMGDIDNVFTKKYRHLGREYDKVYLQRKEGCAGFIENQKEKSQERKRLRAEKKAKKEAEKAQRAKELQSEMEVKAIPVYEEEITIKEISNRKKEITPVKTTVYIEPVSEDEGLDLNIRKKKRLLYGDYSSDRPALRDYNK